MNAFPIEFLNQMQNMLGDEYPAFLLAMDEPPSLALRLNPFRANAAEAAAPYIEDAVPWAENGRYLKPGARPGAGIAHAAGAFYIQEASAMVSAAVLQAQPGEKILDLCAAPGGKSTQAAAALNNQGLIISNEPEPGRARVLAGNMERMGIGNVIVVNAWPHQLSDKLSEFFDAILVDAPCSGEGMFRRDPVARGEWNPASPEGCAKRQKEILQQAAKMLRPGGRLVYSTCTFNDFENEGSIRAFLSEHPDFSPEEFSLPGIGQSENGMLHVYPHRVRGDGHFVAKLRKAGVPMEKIPEKSRKKTGGRPSKPAAVDPAAAIKMLERDVCSLPDFIRDQHFFFQADRVYARPACAPSMDGIKVVSAGLCLMKVGRSHVEPEHALAMALPPELAHRTADLDFNAAAAYLSGAAIPFDGPKGWTLVTHMGMPLGWGKVSDGILKNHLPSALRLQHVAEGDQTV